MGGLALNSFRAAFTEEGVSYLFIRHAAVEDVAHYCVVGRVVKAGRCLRFIIGRLNRNGRASIAQKDAAETTGRGLAYIHLLSYLL